MSQPSMDQPMSVTTPPTWPASTIILNWVYEIGKYQFTLPSGQLIEFTVDDKTSNGPMSPKAFLAVMTYKSKKDGLVEIQYQPHRFTITPSWTMEEKAYLSMLLSSLANQIVAMVNPILFRTQHGIEVDGMEIYDSMGQLVGGALVPSLTPRAGSRTERGRSTLPTL